MKLGQGHARRARHAGGQSMLDYLFCCAALAFFLFVPIQDDPAHPGQSRSTLQLMIDAFHTAYQNMSHAISLPS